MMNFKRNTLLIISILILAVGCNKPEKLSTTDGVEYYLLASENGEAFVQDDYGTYYVKFVDENDSVLVDSKEVGMLPIKIDSASLKKRGSLFSILKEINVGDSIRTTLSASEVFTKGFRQPLSENMQPNDRITVFATAKEKYDSAGFMAWQQEMRQEMMEKMQEEAEAQKGVDEDIIKQYITENNIKADSTESGLFYVITEEGDGPKPEAGQTVQVNYVGKLLNGKVFDTSIKEVAQENDLYDERREPYNPLEFPIGKGRVIRGWDEGISLLNVGSKATLIIPSYLAYGPRGAGGDIGPNEVLVFDVELVGVK